MTAPPTSRSVPWTGILLLASIACGSAAATELYRWTEPDGSITFSPQRPAAGTAFERVDAGASASSGQAPDRSGITTPRPRAEPTAPAMPQPAGRGPDPELAYAPPPLGAAANAPADRQPATTVPAELRERNPIARKPTASSQREERCRELEKRVVSLERRLSTPLSAQDMDDTVLYMARYQQNVDRHCRG